MRYLISIILLLAVNISFAQTQEEIDEAFRTGNYQKAVELTNRKDSIEADKLSKQKRCNSLVSDAKWYFNRKLFKSALNTADKALSYSPNNSAANIIHAQSKEQHALHGNGNWFKLLSIGVTAGMDMMTTNYGMHIGASIKYGYYLDPINVALGVEYHMHKTFEDKYGITNESVELGDQITIPLIVKYNFARATNSSRFYIGAGVEYGITLSTLKDYPGEFYPHNSEAMESTTLAGLCHFGIAMRHFDVGIYYKGYLKDFAKEPYFSYQENNRMGLKLTYYF